jgi:hypothetical protein
MRATRALLPALLLIGCTDTPPPRWAEGGASLAIGPALWKTGEGAVVEILANGKVVEDGHAVFTVDAAGRVYDSENEPVAIVLPDGNVVGTNNAHLGRIGVTNAAPPGGGAAWLTVFPGGQVTHYDPDGERSSDGLWQGCTGPKLRTCTLVSHIYTLERLSRVNGDGVTFGVGVGVGFGI